MGSAEMLKARKLGKSNIEVSVVGLGCNNFGGRTDFEGTRAVVHRALDLGVTLFDTADVYGSKGKSEEFLGELLGPRRKDVVLATKFGLPMNEPRSGGASRRYAMQAVEASLKRLRTDWIDLYQVHYPDPKTPSEETMRALDDLVQQGKVRAIGCSNFSVAQVVQAQDTAQARGLAYFVTCQDEYSLLHRDIEASLVPLMRERGMSLLPYAPLASGFLTGKYRRNAALPAGARLTYSSHHASDVINERNWTMVEKLEAVVKRSGHSMLELAFGWLLAKPFVASVIAGATKPGQIEQNVAVAAHLPPSSVIAEIDAITRRD
jgi:aryl-alcohol dehydrogenase-like predicted oxidoreductase